MNWKETISLINTTRGTGDKKNLNRMRFLLKELGNPETDLPVIHVAGTNGKGTTCAYIAHSLARAGYKTGLYTSPHLERVNERIRINDCYISDQDLMALTGQIAPIIDHLEDCLGEKYYSFEILTALAFLYFQQAGVDFLVLETGVGGKIDATNVVPAPLVSVITSIGYDHTHVLGNTLEEITRHKAGIIKKDCPVVVGPLADHLLAIVKEVSKEMDSNLTIVHPDKFDIVHQTLDYQSFKYGGDLVLETQMIGNHQLINTTLAYEALKIVQQSYPDLTDLDILEGLKTTHWPGRMQKLSDQPVVVLDGAHNEIGVKALRQSIDHFFPGKKITYFAGMMVEKDFAKMFDLLGETADKFYLISPDLTRGFDVDQAVQSLTDKGYQASSVASLQAILDYINQQAKADEIIIIFGSLYLVGDFLKLYHEASG